MNKYHRNENKQRIFIQSLLCKGVSHHHLCLAEIQKQAKQWESFRVNEGEGFRRLWLEVVGIWEARSRLSRSVVSYMISWWGQARLSLPGPEQAVGTKIGEMGSHWPIGVTSQDDCCSGCVSKFYCYIWSDRCLFVYPISLLETNGWYSPFPIRKGWEKQQLAATCAMSYTKLWYTIKIVVS